MMTQPTHTCFGGRTHSTGSDRPSCSTLVKTVARAHVGGGDSYSGGVYSTSPGLCTDGRS